MIRAAIVGLGRWGRSLVASVQGKSKDLRFVLAHTRTRATAEDFCRGQELALVDSYEQVLADPNVDAVVLATPHSLHESQIIAAAAAGKHIHVEKPITLDRSGADRAAEATRKAGVLLAVGYCRRFHPSVVEVRRRLAEGRLGAVISMVAQHTTSTGQFIAPDNWRAAPEEAPGGALTPSACMRSTT
jgi:predicted dehydrogenase